MQTTAIICVTECNDGKEENSPPPGNEISRPPGNENFHPPETEICRPPENENSHPPENENDCPQGMKIPIPVYLLTKKWFW